MTSIFITLVWKKKKDNLDKKFFFSDLYSVLLSHTFYLNFHCRNAELAMEIHKKILKRGTCYIFWWGQKDGQVAR
jgi:hypothetical protein